eukprot:TRINITY_DN2550_c0_g1_i1.p1 TRINITY_DN2550_c0_g1~~TRINITY_DN2550_c0_g1_i1.p1  ORF type:complete len:537 (+),score=89.86 TRINITY_DN2550_c0_g1_i1:83-1693(+)
MLFQDLKVCVHLTEDEEKKKITQTLKDNGAVIIENPTTYPFDCIHLIHPQNVEKLEELKTKGARIVGPQCIYDSIKNNKQLPLKSHPVFSRTLEGLHICCTGMALDLRNATETLVRYMNGNYSSDFTNRTDFLIATEVGTAKYQVAVLRGVPVLKPSWILQCWQMFSLQPIKSSVLPPFAGCIISVTGLATSTRNTICKLVTTYGGTFSADLTRNCTHLIAQSQTGLKFKFATSWGIHVVTLDWLLDSVNLGACADLRKYLMFPKTSPMSTYFSLPPLRGAPGGPQGHLTTSSSSVANTNNSGTATSSCAYAGAASTQMVPPMGLGTSHSCPSNSSGPLANSLFFPRGKDPSYPLLANRYQPYPAHLIHCNSTSPTILPTESQLYDDSLPPEKPTRPNGLTSIGVGSRLSNLTLEKEKTEEDVHRPLSEIVEMCDAIINRSIDSNNVCALLQQVSTSLGTAAPALRSACLEKIVQEFGKVKNTKSFDELSDFLKVEIQQRIGKEPFGSGVTEENSQPDLQLAKASREVDLSSPPPN